jgi:hypothetical protein
VVYFAALNWAALVLFSVLVLTIALFGLSLSGHFPMQAQKLGRKDWGTRAVVASCVVVVALATAKTFGIALYHLPAPMAIIGGGAALLAAPLALQRFPDTFVDGLRGIVVLATISLALVLIAGRVLG